MVFFVNGQYETIRLKIEITVKNKKRRSRDGSTIPYLIFGMTIYDVNGAFIMFVRMIFFIFSLGSKSLILYSHDVPMI